MPVRPAGGTDDGGIGTSYEKVREAISTADRGAGVAVLADLGSSVLTTRAVLADHPDPDAVIMADAPFVEGAVAAAVLAASADLKTVVTAAEEARDARKL